jgi:micrococcal nuclease
MVWVQRFSVILFLGSFLCWPAQAEEPWRLLDDGRIELEQGQALRLASVRLVEQKSLRTKADALIRALLSNQEWAVAEPTTKDRYGDLVGIIEFKGGKSLQTTLIEAGLARVYPQVGEGGDMSALFQNETKAREAKAGLWALDIYQIVSAEDAIPQRFDLRNYYQLVEGTIVAVAKVRGNIYLNFGEDWREDFTIMIPKVFAKAVKAQGLKYKELEGKKVRVRGWFRLYGGPLIDVTDVRQIEVLN